MMKCSFGVFTVYKMPCGGKKKLTLHQQKNPNSQKHGMKEISCPVFWNVFLLPINLQRLVFSWLQAQTHTSATEAFLQFACRHKTYTLGVNVLRAHRLNVPVGLWLLGSFRLSLVRFLQKGPLWSFVDAQINIYSRCVEETGKYPYFVKLHRSVQSMPFEEIWLIYCPLLVFHGTEQVSVWSLESVNKTAVWQIHDVWLKAPISSSAWPFHVRRLGPPHPHCSRGIGEFFQLQKN